MSSTLQVSRATGTPASSLNTIFCSYDASKTCNLKIKMSHDSVLSNSWGWAFWNNRALTTPISSHITELHPRPVLELAKNDDTMAFKRNVRGGVPSPYPRFLFHGLRSAQLIAAIVVSGIMAYFIHYLRTCWNCIPTIDTCMALISNYNTMNRTREYWSSLDLHCGKSAQPRLAGEGTDWQWHSSWRCPLERSLPSLSRSHSTTSHTFLRSSTWHSMVDCPYFGRWASRCLAGQSRTRMCW